MTKFQCYIINHGPAIQWLHQPWLFVTQVKAIYLNDKKSLPERIDGLV